VHHFAVASLPLLEKSERLAQGGKIADARDRKLIEKGIAPEEPAEAGTRAFSGGPPTRNQPCAKVGIVYESLIKSDLRPFESEIQLL
jgi:hypothetical protein